MRAFLIIFLLHLPIRVSKLCSVHLAVEGASSVALVLVFQRLGPCASFGLVRSWIRAETGLESAPARMDPPDDGPNHACQPLVLTGFLHGMVFIRM